MFSNLTRPALLLHLEGAAVFALAVSLYWYSKGDWLLFLLLILAPDLSMLSYLGGNKIGAAVYNLFHNYIVVALLGLYGLFAGNLLAIHVALIWFAHIGADRLLGFGLKYDTAFKDTHLNRV